MRFTITHPMHSHPYNPELVTGSGIATVAAAAEAAGFHGFGFTDHPAPSQRWLESGGHDALDPFVAMGYAAARTTTLRLIPNIVVLPYRNPFVVAKSGATLDMLSDGRFTLAVGVGYLKREFAALGVEFDERAALFEEALEVIRGIWTGDDISFEGRHFSAKGITAHPRPVSRPHPPIWIGGNTAAARQRVVDVRRRMVPVSRARRPRPDRPHRGAGVGRASRRRHRRSAAPMRRCGPGLVGHRHHLHQHRRRQSRRRRLQRRRLPVRAGKACGGWGDLGAGSGAGRQPGACGGGDRALRQLGHRVRVKVSAYAVTRAMSATSPSAPMACASATPLRRPTRKAVPT